jgi:site-specific DNA-methyltransferase (adenine-specific)
MDNFTLESPHSPSGFHSFEWATPPRVFRDLDAEFHFTLDACASEANTKCLRWFDVKSDGLIQDWGRETVWCNPPYGRGQVGAFVKKAYEAAQGGATVVMLLPVSTSTAWFHDYCIKGEIRFLRGRLKFGGCKGSPTFSSMIVIFRGNNG